MSLIRALIAAAEAERFRCMTGGGKGILKAIATRDHTEQPLSHEDYEWAKTILGQALDKEWDLIAEGRAADEAFEQSASRLASRHTLHELRKLCDRGLTYRTEIIGDTRRTSAAVNNEAHRHSWEHQRLYDRAIQVHTAALS